MKVNITDLVNNALAKLTPEDFIEWLVKQSADKMFNGTKKQECPLFEYINSIIPNTPGITLLVYKTYFCIQYKSDDIYYAERKLPVWAVCFSTIANSLGKMSIATSVNLVQILERKTNLTTFLDFDGFTKPSLFREKDIEKIFSLRYAPISQKSNITVLDF